MKVHLLIRVYWQDLDGYYSQTDETIIKAFKDIGKAKKTLEEYNRNKFIYNDEYSNTSYKLKTLEVLK